MHLSTTRENVTALPCEMTVLSLISCIIRHAVLEFSNKLLVQLFHILE